MPRSRRQSETEWQWREQARQAHEARERRARWEAKRGAEEKVWLLHRLRFRCERCGVASAGPVIEIEGSPVHEEIVNWVRPDDLVPCQVCGRWLCRRCGRSVVGVGSVYRQVYDPLEHGSELGAVHHDPQVGTVRYTR